MNEAALIIGKLQLTKHPEGGWYREVYRSDEQLPSSTLPHRYQSAHCFSTSIYYLLENDDFSAFHRIASDETWHFYLGGPLIIYCIYPDGSVRQILLGNNLTDGQILQFTIPRNCWFAARNYNTESFSLVGCTVSPGFEFSDFELGSRMLLAELLPQHNSIISELTRK
jgi:uncharacterized protein